ncbi:hypothetical protein LEMLEM_LOCUS27799, partial [Lemmus lemmus]
PQGGQPDLPHLARHAEARLREVRPRRRRVHPAGPLHQGVAWLRLRPLPRQARRRRRHGCHGWGGAGRPRAAGADGALRPSARLTPQPPGSAAAEVWRRRLRTAEPQVSGARARTGTKRGGRPAGAQRCAEHVERAPPSWPGRRRSPAAPSETPPRGEGNGAW